MDVWCLFSYRCKYIMRYRHLLSLLNLIEKYNVHCTMQCNYWYDNDKLFFSTKTRMTAVFLRAGYFYRSCKSLEIQQDFFLYHFFVSAVLQRKVTFFIAGAREHSFWHIFISFQIIYHVVSFTEPITYVV